MKEVEYSSEEEFLKHYNKDEFEKLSMTADTLVFSVSEDEQDNYRKLNEKHFSVLLVKRNSYPFKDMWCLPGGFVRMDETAEEAAERILAKEANVHNIYLEQLYTLSDVNRDPRMRIVSTSYMALIDKNRLNDKLSEEASWFNVDIAEDDKEAMLVLDNGTEQISVKMKKHRKNITSENYEYEVVSNSGLAFDHAKVITLGANRLKNKIEYTDIVFNMMPEYFTLGELQQVYEAILGKKLLDPAFRRIIASKVEKTNKVKTGGGHRPSALFKYKNN
ncbi:MAG: NUDIX hydrolase [Clostridia bacterium]|nr:NUDIX hydrolase [Clostridia bacterium]